MRYFIVRIYRESPPIDDGEAGSALVGVAEDEKGRLHPFHGIEELSRVMKEVGTAPARSETSTES